MNTIQNLKYKVLDAANYTTEHRFDFVQFYPTKTLLNQINDMLPISNEIMVPFSGFAPKGNFNESGKLTLGGIIDGEKIPNTKVTSLIKYATPDNSNEELTDFVTVMENQYVNKEVISKLKEFLSLNYHVEKYSRKVVKNTLPTFVEKISKENSVKEKN